MKKVFKWIGIVLLSPILLFVILTILIYLPPVQNWLVGKAASYASEKTGMEITIEHVNLAFPLDLGVDGIRVLHPNDSLPGTKDTIADIKRLVVDVQFMPLFEKKVVINELALTNSRLNTNGFVASVRVKGDVEKLSHTSALLKIFVIQLGRVHVPQRRAGIAEDVQLHVQLLDGHGWSDVCPFVSDLCFHHS
jgi:hypothetical protein